MQHKVYSMIGLAKRASKIGSGDETCTKTITAGKALLILVAEDSSENTVKKFKDMSVHRNVPFYIFGNQEMLGKFCGKYKRAVVVVTDRNFADRIIELLK